MVAVSLNRARNLKGQGVAKARRVSRSGQDSVDHPRHGSDDYSNSLVGALWAARSIQQPITIPPGIGVFVTRRVYPSEAPPVPTGWH